MDTVESMRKLANSLLSCCVRWAALLTNGFNKKQDSVPEVSSEPPRPAVCVEVGQTRSRAGDPDLHSHVAVANKVQTLDGKWLAVDCRPLHKTVVSASETYNAAPERHLVRRPRRAIRRAPGPRQPPSFKRHTGRIGYRPTRATEGSSDDVGNQ